MDLDFYPESMVKKIPAVLILPRFTNTHNSRTDIGGWKNVKGTSGLQCCAIEMQQYYISYT